MQQGQFRKQTEKVAGGYINRGFPSGYIQKDRKRKKQTNTKQNKTKTNKQTKQNQTASEVS